MPLPDRVLPTAAGDRPGGGELFAALPVSVLVVDPLGCIAQANAAAEQLLNQSERFMVGQRLEAVIGWPRDQRGPDQQETGERGTGRQGTGRQGAGRRDARQDIAIYDVGIETARGVRLRVDLVDAEMNSHPGWRAVTLHPAAPAYRLGHGTDRSAARSAEGAAAMLAHEIKNPLSGIRGAAQLIDAGELTDLITTEVDRIAALIDRMQDFGDTRPRALEPHNIYPLLDHVRRLALAGFGRGVPIEERFDPSLPLALIDRDALVQILVNLLKNAREAVGDLCNPRIILSTAYRHGLSMSGPGRPRVALPIEICVIDNGPGASAAIADHLFDPFVSESRDGQRRRRGRGLGLALVDKLVGDMGGIVQYAREGSPALTVFRVLLPRAPS